MIFKLNRLICLFVILQVWDVFFSSSASAQDQITTSEIGIGLGGFNYIGELAPNYRFFNNRPALTVFYRRDIIQPLTLRGGLMVGHRLGEENTIGDAGYYDMPLPNFRRSELKLTLAELSVVAEYNFLDYYDLSQNVRISPYFFAGVAGLVYNRRLDTASPLVNPSVKPFDTNLAISIPFGVGVKYALNKHWNLGIEFGARKIFIDDLDHLSEVDSKQTANPYDNDWYFYNGISLSYTIYRINCPPTYRKKPGLLD
jgi:opacity protein-like surface antigen